MVRHTYMHTYIRKKTKTSWHWNTNSSRQLVPVRVFRALANARCVSTVSLGIPAAMSPHLVVLVVLVVSQSLGKRTHG